MGNRVMEGCTPGQTRTMMHAEAQRIVHGAGFWAQGGLAGLCRYVEIAGSIRREEPTVNDIDLVLVLKPDVDPVLADALARFGVTNWTVERMQCSFVWPTERPGLSVQADLFVVRDPLTVGAELLTWTGSYEHNVALRQYAKMRGLKLSQKGLFRAGKPVLAADSTLGRLQALDRALPAANREQHVYWCLGLPEIPPTKRREFATIPQLQGLAEAFAAEGESFRFER